MKAYITKYALTVGIELFDGEIAERISAGMFCYSRDGWDCYAHGEGKEWHRTWSRAAARARVLRDKKIASHASAIKKLKAMDWPDAEPEAK